VQHFLKNGASPDSCDGCEVALVLATTHGHTDVVESLLQRKASADLADSRGKNARMCAYSSDVIDLLYDDAFAGRYQKEWQS